MRIPTTPPSWPEILSQVIKDPDRLSRVRFDRAPTLEGRYIHWDRLKYHEPPDGLDHREWWAAIKMARSSNSKPIPLVDRLHRRFSFVNVDPVPEYVCKVDQQAAGRIEVPDHSMTNTEARDRYIINSLIEEEAITSSQLEGASTTIRVAKEMLRSKREPRNRSEQMIVNNFVAMRKIADLVQQPLSKNAIFDLHRTITEGTLDEAEDSGRFRRSDENVRVFEQATDTVLHIPPGADELNDRMTQLCDFANGKTPDYFIHPVVRAIIVHFWLAYDHPFIDGNGRCARALFYWSMLRQGFWLCEYISISQTIKIAPAKYAKAFLYTETDGNDLTYFVLYHLRILLRAIDDLNRYVRKKLATVRKLENQLRGSSLQVNSRQLELLNHALRHPDGKYYISAHQERNRVVYQTARSDLQGLMQLGLLVRGKQGKLYVYYPSPDLERRLESYVVSQDGHGVA